MIDAWRAEPPESCAHTMGMAPYRVQVGMALGRQHGYWSEPGVVVWQESGVFGVFGPAVCFEARYAHFAVAEALQAVEAATYSLERYCTVVLADGEETTR